MDQTCGQFRGLHACYLCPVCCSAVVTSLQEAREESSRAQAQVDQTCGQVTGLHEELQALKTRLASHAALQQVRMLQQLDRRHDGLLSSMKGQSQCLNNCFRCAQAVCEDIRGISE